MNKPYGNQIVHPDGTVHITKAETRRAKDPEGPPWTAISRCGIQFGLDESIEPDVTKNMRIMTDADATCEACQAVP
jgi:hypothetical protein